MIKVMASTISGVLPQGIYKSLTRFLKDYVFGWHNRYYGEFGEDIVVNCLSSYKKNGFYIDIGCYHPKELSTTYYLYKNQGWSGIVIDANPDTIKSFKKMRKRDNAVNLGVGASGGKLDYYMFDNPSHNTFSAEIRKERSEQGLPPHTTLSIEVRRLEDILDTEIPDNVKEIDYLNIDVEGFDLDVLKSNNWDKYRPKIISVEDIEFSMDEPDKSEIHVYMKSLNYKLKSWNYISLIYERGE